MKILIAIHGSHSQPEQMAAQRETWLRDLHITDYKYFLGEPSGQDSDVVYGAFADGPYWERHIGGPRTAVTNQKTEALALFAYANGYDFLFKCDDDTYIRVQQLLSSGFEEHDYVGITDEHYSPKLGMYRWAQGGAGYWLSRCSLAIIAEHGLTHQLPEDFAVGQALASHGIHPHHDARYTPGISEANIQDAAYRKDAITLHKINSAWMRRLYREIGPSPESIACGFSHMANPEVDDAAGE